jgi:pimeloyl-ACP methyl ester carboxylesterase
MSSRRIACVCQSGFTEVPWRGTGIGQIHKLLSQGPLRDRVKCPLLALEPWNADARTLAEKTRVMTTPDDRIIHIGHSYGCGEGLHHYAKELARRNSMGQGFRKIDLAILIDPVTRYPLFKWRSLRSGLQFEVPSNVARVACWRTLHVPRRSRDQFFRPVGQSPRCGDGTKLLRHVVYGTAEDLTAAGAVFGGGDEIRSRPQDQAPTHTTVDELPEVMSDVVELVTDFIEGRRA